MRRYGNTLLLARMSPCLAFDDTEVCGHAAHSSDVIGDDKVTVPE
jgi:hypothetical protein